MKLLARRTLFLFMTATLAFAPAVRAATTVANGDFETGDFTGWTLFGNTGSGFVGVDPSGAQAGSYGAFFGPNGSAGGISQSLATTVGAAYDLSFWLKSEADVFGVATPNRFSFSWGGIPVTTLTDLPESDFSRYTSRLVATSASTTLSFSFENDPAFFDLDSVAVTEVTEVVASVPEPSSVAMLAGGGLALAAVVRRRRRG